MKKLQKKTISYSFFTPAEIAAPQIDCDPPEMPGAYAQRYLRSLTRFSAGGRINSHATDARGNAAEYTLPINSLDAFFDKLQESARGSGKPIKKLAALVADARNVLEQLTGENDDLKKPLKPYRRLRKFADCSCEKVFKKLKLSKKSIAALSAFRLYFGCDWSKYPFMQFAADVIELTSGASFSTSPFGNRKLKWAQRKANAADAHLSLLTVHCGLDWTAKALGITDGASFFCAIPEEKKKDKKKREKKEKKAKKKGNFTEPEAPVPASDVDLLFSCRSITDPDCAPNGGCVCSITAPINTEKWERLPQSEYFRYQNAVARDLIARIEAATGCQLLAHLEEITVETPLDYALNTPCEANEKLSAGARKLFPEQQEMTVAAVTERNGAISFRLKKANGYTAANFRAGQHIMVSVPGAEEAVPFSLCASPALTQEGLYEITAFSPDCAAAEGLRRILETDETVTVSAPQGTLCYNDLRDAGHVIGIAAGSGIAPFLSMAAAVRDRIENVKLTVLYSGNGACADVEELFGAISADCGKVRLIRIPADGKGYGLTEAKLKDYLPHEAYSVFICGPDDLCEEAFRVLKPLGLVKKSIRCESHGSNNAATAK